MRGWRAWARPVGEGEPRMPIFHEAGSQFFIFRVFRVFRGYDCLAILVCIRVHSWFKNGLSCISWFPNRYFVVMIVLPF